MYKKLKGKGRAASDYYAGRYEYFFLTPSSTSLLKDLLPLMPQYCRGRLLDAGAGRGAYRELLAQHIDDYVGLDVAPSPATALVGDAQRLPFADNSFDTVFCSQVLEHVPQPWSAIAEFERVVKPGGYVVLTVPHLSWLHNEPHDYFRYTCHGLSSLVEKTGLQIKHLAPAGGLLSFLGHIPSTLVMNLTFGIPLLHPLVRGLNRCWCNLIAACDARIEKKKIFALNYLCVAQKPLPEQQD
ncbi:MAG: class I SAM-dependent methyltransferase [Desulfuromonadales bacterium]|nr:class I SAM-dependent methyltransferase [Desulfuromonadales bacterium]